MVPIIQGPGRESGCGAGLRALTGVKPRRPLDRPPASVIFVLSQNYYKSFAILIEFSWVKRYKPASELIRWGRIPAISCPGCQRPFGCADGPADHDVDGVGVPNLPVRRGQTVSGVREQGSGNPNCETGMTAATDLACDPGDALDWVVLLAKPALVLLISL